MNKNYGPARYIVTWPNGLHALLRGNACSASVLDTALDFAKKVSAFYRDRVVVWEQRDGENTLRAYAEKGVVLWTKPCKSCSGSGKVYDFMVGVPISCPECIGSGRVSDDAFGI